MKRLIFICLVFVFTNTFAQQYTLPTELVQTFMVDQNPRTGLDIIVETKLGKDSFYETIVKYSGNSESFKLKPLTYPNFEVKLKQAIKDLIESTKIDDVALTTKVPDNKVIDSTIPYVFTQIVTYHNSEEERPIVATIFLKSSDIQVFYGKKKDTLLNTLEKASLEIKV